MTSKQLSYSASTFTNVKPHNYGQNSLKMAGPSVSRLEGVHCNSFNRDHCGGNPAVQINGVPSFQG